LWTAKINNSAESAKLFEQWTSNQPHSSKANVPHGVINMQTESDGHKADKKGGQSIKTDNAYGA